MRILLTAKFQIGKKGVTPGVIESIKLILKTHKHVRISTLKSSGRDRVKIHEMAKQIIDKIGFPCASRVIGFTIIIRKIVMVKKKK